MEGGRCRSQEIKVKLQKGRAGEGWPLTPHTVDEGSCPKQCSVAFEHGMMEDKRPSPAARSSRRHMAATMFRYYTESRLSLTKWEAAYLLVSTRRHRTFSLFSHQQAQVWICSDVKRRTLQASSHSSAAASCRSINNNKVNMSLMRPDPLPPSLSPRGGP